jgi:dolichol-phosphate mannosyltransferase
LAIVNLSLSVGIPCYNEAQTIEALLTKVRAQAPLVAEIIVVDDGSTDGTWAALESIRSRWTAPPALVIARLERNQGKGAATRKAIRLATQPYFLIQDADLELDPHDYAALVAPISEGRADCVFGNRFGRFPKSKLNTLSRFANWAVTFLSNLFYGLRLEDQACGYKLLSTDLARSLALGSDGFEICSEMTAKLGRRKIKIANVPVTYNPRTMQEGKKIRWKDGFIAVWTLARYRL